MAHCLTPIQTPDGANVRRWIWSQHWDDVLFLHWPVPSAVLRPQIPSSLEIDIREGFAWVSLVLFRLRVRMRWLPFLPSLSNLVEANLRTYVRHRDRPGIWFLGVHADNAWAIRLARMLTPMPYIGANMCYQRQGDHFQFKVQPRSSTFSALSLTFHLNLIKRTATEATLDAWLLERYRLFITDRRQQLLEANVDHPPWVIQDADVAIAENKIGEQFGLELLGSPAIAHFSPGVRARFGAFRAVRSPSGKIVSAYSWIEQ